jgi:hypothetical protein
MIENGCWRSKQTVSKIDRVKERGDLIASEAATQLGGTAAGKQANV